MGAVVLLNQGGRHANWRLVRMRRSRREHQNPTHKKEKCHIPVWRVYSEESRVLKCLEVRCGSDAHAVGKYEFAAFIAGGNDQDDDRQPEQVTEPGKPGFGSPVAPFFGCPE